MSLLESARSGKHRKGKVLMVNHLLGKRLTPRQAIYAKCYDCNGMGESDECDDQECPLWQYSQFKIKSETACTEPPRG